MHVHFAAFAASGRSRSRPSRPLRKIRSLVDPLGPFLRTTRPKKVRPRPYGWLAPTPPAPTGNRCLSRSRDKLSPQSSRAQLAFPPACPRVRWRSKSSTVRGPRRIHHPRSPRCPPPPVPDLRGPRFARRATRDPDRLVRRVVRDRRRPVGGVISILICACIPFGWSCFCPCDRMTVYKAPNGTLYNEQGAVTSKPCFANGCANSV